MENDLPSNYKTRRLAALLGNVAITVFVPPALIAWTLLREIDLIELENMTPLLGVITIVEIPFAMVFAELLFRATLEQKTDASLGVELRNRIIHGAALTWFNVPLWFFAAMASDTGWKIGIGMVFLRFVSLFFATGSLCGAWVSWQAWKAMHPEARFQFSLQSLVWIMLAAGLVLGIFAPR